MNMRACKSFSIMAACTTALFVAIPHCSAQQRLLDGGRPLAYGDRVFAEAAQLPGASRGSGSVAVFVRVTRDFVVFQKSGSPHPDSTYRGGIEVSADLLDSTGRMRASLHERIPVFARTYEETESRTIHTLAQLVFAARPGDYVAVVEVSDGASSRKQEFRLPVSVKSASGHAPILFSAIPVEEDTQAGQGFRIAGFGGSVPFGKAALIAAAAVADGSTQWKWTMRERRGERTRTVGESGIVPSKTLGGVSTSDARGAVVAFPLEKSGDETTSLYLFEFPFDTLEAGDYDFVLEAANAERRDSISQRLRVYWDEMPFTLRNPEMALLVMWHILTKEESKALDSGPDEELADRIRAWWRAGNPTPGAARNREMEEYFRRADEAYFAFQTLKRSNGAMTDRGKIHILYGAPDSRRRELKPGEPTREIWSYTELNRTFIFVDRDRSGDFRLLTR